MERNERFIIIINIANEWIGTFALNKDNLWKDTYISAVKSMREIGIENAIMIDASGYGQETGPITKNAKKVLDADPDKNTVKLDLLFFSKEI